MLTESNHGLAPFPLKDALDSLERAERSVGEEGVPSFIRTWRDSRGHGILLYRIEHTVEPRLCRNVSCRPSFSAVVTIRSEALPSR